MGRWGVRCGRGLLRVGEVVDDLEGEAGEVFDTDFGPAVVSHTCANDGVVEGIKLADGRAFSVQYHPEAAAGPHDANYLFDQFVDLMDEGKH